MFGQQEAAEPTARGCGDSTLRAAGTGLVDRPQNSPTTSPLRQLESAAQVG